MSRNSEGDQDIKLEVDPQEDRCLSGVQKRGEKVRCPGSLCTEQGLDPGGKEPFSARGNREGQGRQERLLKFKGSSCCWGLVCLE